VADVVLRWSDWKGGDFGIRDPAKADADQYTGENVYPYSSGLLGVRAGAKVMAVTGLPPHAIVPGPLGFWKRTNTPTAVIVLGNRPYEFPVAGGAATPWAIYPETPIKPIRFVSGAGIPYSLSNNKLYKHPNTTTTTLITTPAAMSHIIRWGYYFIGIDANVPWRIWFSTVSAAGAQFDTWSANDYLDVGDTEPITTLAPIFNTLYVGKQTGWNAVSGVLGTLASIRGVAIGQGPVDPRAMCVSTDNRIIYWPLERSPAFFNGERVAVQDLQELVGARTSSIGDTVLATNTSRRLILAADDGTKTTLYTWADGAWSRATFSGRLAALAPGDPRDSAGLPEDVILGVLAPTVVGEVVRIVAITHSLDRPGNLGDTYASPGDAPLPGDQVVPLAGQCAMPAYYEPIGRQVRVRSVIIQFRKWNMGGPDFTCEIQLRVNVLGRYGGGRNDGELHRWFEPSERNPEIGDDPFGLGRVTDDGVDDSWRVNVGSQGFGNGFQIELPRLVGVGIREIVALCDVKTERV
jgi:hypothetical protein